jgi:hypothetical protein
VEAVVESVPKTDEVFGLLLTVIVVILALESKRHAAAPTPTAAPMVPAKPACLPKILPKNCSSSA